jgi:hypothetical protein
MTTMNRDEGSSLPSLVLRWRVNWPPLTLLLSPLFAALLCSAHRTIGVGATAAARALLLSQLAGECVFYLSFFSLCSSLVFIQTGVRLAAND